MALGSTLVGFGGRLPVVRQNDRQTDATLLVNVRMVDLGFKVYFWRLKRVLRWEVNLNSKRSFVVRRIILAGQSESEWKREKEREWTECRLVHSARSSQSNFIAWHQQKRSTSMIGYFCALAYLLEQ